ncbi:MAG: hypothetical protein HKN64_00835 [Woeseiaceae bacterium]|nr:hypothetical protein [Woeseiaceae bacterium]
MKFHTLLIIGLTLGVAGCGDKEAAAPAARDEAKMSGESASPGASDMDETVRVSDAVVRHMHLHAEQLHRLNNALAAGDLDAAQTPAYWLSRHETMSVFPEAWRPHLLEMRAAALEVEAATDIDMALAAAARIAAACKACHAAAGFDVDISRTEWE